MHSLDSRRRPLPMRRRYCTKRDIMSRFKLTVTLLAVATVLFLSGSPARADLEGYWAFNEGAGTAAVDSSGNANNGTFAASSWTAGQSGGAGNFALNVTGGSQAVSVPAGGFGNIGTNNQVTLSLWVYGDAGQQPRNNTTVQGMNGGNRRFALASTF